MRDEDVRQSQTKFAVLYEEDPLPDKGRQRFLSDHLAITPDPVAGVFPFAGEPPLSRADVMWLLANSRRVDLRGADLSGVNLGRIDLTRTLFGLDLDDYEYCSITAVLANYTELSEKTESLQRLAATLPSTYGLGVAPSDGDVRRQAASVSLRKANLMETNLSHVTLAGADLQGATLTGADLTGADLSGANLADARLNFATLLRASLNKAILVRTNLGNADLRNCGAEFGIFFGADLSGADLRQASLAYARLGGARLSRARFDGGTNLDRAALIENEMPVPPGSRTAALLADVDWGGVNVVVVDWEEVHAIGEEEELRRTLARRAELRERKGRLRELDAALEALKAKIESKEPLSQYMVGNPPSLRADLSETDRVEVKQLRDDVQRCLDLETEAQRLKKGIGDDELRLPSHLLELQEASARAYKQLANVLASQGVTSESARFAYRALKLRRLVPRRERQLATIPPESQPALRRWRAALSAVPVWSQKLRAIASTESKVLASFALDTICGYGYRPGKALLAYGVIVAAFAGGYVWAGLEPSDAFIFSITSFHGRGFSGLAAGSAYARAVQIAAGEAFFGLLFEIILIITFTRRLFAD